MSTLHSSHPTHTTSLHSSRRLRQSVAKMYGMDEASATGTNGKLLRRNGLAVLSLGLHAACLLFKGTDLNTSFGLASLPHAADALASLLNDDADTVGPSKMGDALILAFTAAASYGGLSNADWAPTAFKACAAFALASGLPCFVDPKAAIGLWEVKGDDDLTPGVVSAVGSNLLVLGVLAASLAWGVDTVTAFGYAAATALVAGGYNNFVSEDFAKLGCNSNALAVWTLLFGAIAAVILL